MTDIINTFIYTVLDRQNITLIIFSSMRHRQHIQPNFMPHNVRASINTRHNEDNAKLTKF